MFLINTPILLRHFEINDLNTNGENIENVLSLLTLEKFRKDWLSNGFKQPSETLFTRISSSYFYFQLQN